MSGTKSNLTEYKSRRKKLSVMKLAVLAIAVAVIGYFAVSAVKIVNLTIEKNRVETENERLINQKEDLEQKLEIVNSSDYLESLARNKLRLVKGNEILFVLPSFRAAPEGEQLTPEEELFRLRLQEAEENALKEAADEKAARSGPDDGASSGGDGGEGASDIENAADSITQAVDQAAGSGEG